jgi:dipeptidyl aminopeptidase/acylaminoacyl peptidase
MLATTACTPPQPARVSGPPELIPRAVLFGNPDRTMVRLSPAGERLSFLAPVDGVLNVWVGPREDPSAAEPVTRDRDRGIRTASWAYTSRHVLYLQDSGGDENWRVYSVDVESGAARDLTPVEGAQARIHKASHRVPAEILVGLNDRDKRFHDLYRVDLATGERELVEENPGFGTYVSDDDLELRFANRGLPDGGEEILARGAGGWEPFETIAMEDVVTTHLVGFDASGQVAYMLDSRDRNTAALFAVDLGSGERTLIHEDPRADVADAMIHPTEKTIQAVAANYERQRWTVLDASIAADLEALRAVAGGEIDVVSRSLDDRHWIVAFGLADRSTTFYRYDREGRRADLLFTASEELSQAPLAPMHPVVLTSRDGLELVSYLTLPRESDADRDGRPEAPLPMVVFVHGGPWSRSRWGYHPIHQWLANRGYAVLDVNYRGSTGFGKDFVNAAVHEWGGKMSDDLIDGVEWAVAEGIAERDRVAIFGGSFGGYAVLVGMTKTPEVFACGVDLVGPSNLANAVDRMPPYWKPFIAMWKARVGDPGTEEGLALLRERSPLNHVDRIARPLLIGQGANDPRVVRSESDRLVAAMEERGIPVTYVVFPDEGHGFAKPRNRMAFQAVAESFLAGCLGGRAEPIGDDFEGSSITVPAGAEHVAGLSEALPTADEAG